MGLNNFIQDDSSSADTTNSPEEPSSDKVYDEWHEPTHSRPAEDEDRRTSEGWKRQHSSIDCGYNHNFLPQYHGSDFRGPDPPKGAKPEWIPDELHEEWVDTTGEWRGMLLKNKQNTCVCGEHVWMNKRCAWLRCSQCGRVLVDLEEWDISYSREHMCDWEIEWYDDEVVEEGDQGNSSEESGLMSFVSSN